MKQPRGVLLLMSLVMTSVVLTASLILGTIIVREVRLSTISDKGITAFYASESAGEQAMYRLLKLGEDPASLTQNGSFVNGATWETRAQEAASEFVYDYIGEDKRVELNAFNKDEAAGAAGVDYFSIAWSSGETLEVEVVEWDGETLTELTPFQFSCSNAPCTPAVVNLSPNYAYRLVLIARGAAITDAIATMYAANGTEIEVTSPRTVYATGDYGGARQAVQILMPVPAPWSGGFAPPPAASNCGNGIVDDGETCDDSNTTGGDGCSAACLLELPPPPVCGDGFTEAPEECDDGNTAGNDGCSAICESEPLTFCGDGTTQNPNGNGGAEQCDDGNTASGDGCSSTCQTEDAPVLTSIIVSPNPATPSFVTGRSALERVPFTAQGKDQYGNDIAIVPAPTWTRLTGFGGIISSTGEYVTANTDTTFSVQATSGSISGEASGTVFCPPCTTIDLVLNGYQAQKTFPWYTGGYYVEMQNIAYPRCSSQYYATSGSVVTPIQSSCQAQNATNDCGQYTPYGTAAFGMYGPTYGWGITTGRYTKSSDGGYGPTAPFSAGVLSFCK